jgi:uncharacterized protein with LGFP repeats
MSDNPIRDHYLNHGGAAGFLGEPLGEEEQLSDGRRQHYRGELHGGEHPVSIRIPAERAASCHFPPERYGTPLESTISWSRRTGAHVVRGDIRDLWLQLGAESGELGYPVTDELPTPDGRGRRSEFERGEIRWFPDTGAELVVQAPQGGQAAAEAKPAKTSGTRRRAPQKRASGDSTSRRRAKS